MNLVRVTDRRDLQLNYRSKLVSCFENSVKKIANSPSQLPSLSSERDDEELNIQTNWFTDWLSQNFFKPIVVQLIETFYVSNWTRNFNDLFTRANLWTLSWTNKSSPHLHNLFLRSLILSPKFTSRLSRQSLLFRFYAQKFLKIFFCEI
jgi:hypothetical protein